MRGYASEVLPRAREWRREGRRTALVTLVGAVGSTPRPVGSQMLVDDRGESLGLLTGGCADAAIVAEALAALAAASNRCVRYGEGSPYLDVKLPCGSAIDVHFDVGLSDADVDALIDAQSRRAPASLWIERATNLASIEVGPERGDRERGAWFRRAYLPAARLVILGKGPLCPLLAQMATLAELEVVVLTPDAEVAEASRPHAALVLRLTTPDAFEHEGFDAWTAVVSLFHDHGWEPPILERALASRAFYVGALGSRKTHAARLDLLRGAGVGEEELKRIRGPVGLDIGARSPPEIAVSILAEVIQVMRRA